MLINGKITTFSFFYFVVLWAGLKSNHEKAIEAMKLIDSNMLCQALILTRSK